MNIFRLVADLSHLASIFILLYSIEKNQSLNGLSLKSQALYFIVYVTRYLDVFFHYVSFYNTLMKIVFLASSSYTIYVMTNKYQVSIKAHVDTFPVRYLLGISFILGIVTAQKYTVTNVLWTFSMWLEASAIIPQFFVLQRTGEAENITAHYLFALGIYRALYIPNWIYRYFSNDKLAWVPVAAGIVQSIVYSDFFYIYYKKVMKGKKFELPV